MRDRLKRLAFLALLIAAALSTGCSKSCIDDEVCEGATEHIDCDRIAGWAWNASQPNTPMNVEIYADNMVVGKVLADGFRPDLVTAGKGDGKHGFSFELPASLHDGKTHTIRAVAGTYLDLTGNLTSTTITCSNKKNGATTEDTDPGVAAASLANYGGAVDTINCNAISGWVWNSANVNEKIKVDILVDNKLIGTVPASNPRPDLLKMSASPNFGFELLLPPELKDGKPHSVSANVTGGAHEIKVWEKIQPTFTCAPK